MLKCSQEGEQHPDHEQKVICYQLELENNFTDNDKSEEVRAPCTLWRIHREISCSRACMGEPPPNLLGRDNHGGPFGRGQELLVKKALQIQKTFSEERSTEMESWLLDCCEEEVGREEQS